MNILSSQRHAHLPKLLAPIALIHNYVFDMTALVQPRPFRRQRSISYGG